MRIRDDELSDALDDTPTRWDDAAGVRHAAVLAPICAEGGRDHLLFTKRRDDLQTHAGEISFPGGGREGDESPLACALRETEEEIGLPADAVEVLGGLVPRRSRYGYHVHAVVGRIPGVDSIVLDPREVESLLVVEVAALLDESRWEWRELGPPTHRRRVPFFGHDGQTLWGLTAWFTRELLDHIRDRRPRRRR